jgi:hypothetical protein
MPQHHDDAGETRGPGGASRGGPGRGADIAGGRPADQDITRRTGNQGQQRTDQDAVQDAASREANKGKGDGGGGGGSQKINAPQQGKSQNGSSQAG